MQSLALILEAIFALVAVGVAVGAPLIGMKMHRRHATPAVVPSSQRMKPVRDELPVAA